MTFHLTNDQSLTSGNTATIGIGKSRALLIPISIAGMLPNSSFSFFVDGIDMTWATAQSGERMGSGLLSDAFGRVNFNYYAEMTTINATSLKPIIKYHNFQLKNIRGEIKVTMILPQTLRVRT